MPEAVLTHSLTHPPSLLPACLCDTSPEQLARTFTLANDLSGGTLLLRPTGITTLAAYLAVPNDLDWSIPETLKNYCIADYACGTGGLFSPLTREPVRKYRDLLALRQNTDDVDAMDQLGRASRDRLMLDARLAAIAVFDGGTHLDSLTETLRQSSLYKDEQAMLLVRAWEAAVEGALEDGLFTLDEENALSRYITHFNLSQSKLDARGVHTSLIKAAVLREISEGVVPDRQNLRGNVPFNLMKSEKLVWVMDDVDYIETVVRRERTGSSHGLSIRIARGLYYRPSSFRSRVIEREETVHQDTGLLGFTTKHIYFSGPKKKFRVRYDKIVDFDPYDDGFGIMEDNQTAKPQVFRTGDGWFSYNLAVNLAQM